MYVCVCVCGGGGGGSGGRGSRKHCIFFEMNLLCMIFLDIRRFAGYFFLIITL